MDTSVLAQSEACVAYDALAPYYDELVADYDHDAWIAALERVALRCGLDGRRVLDLGCGTGRAFRPLLERGYAVTGCDLSPGMVEMARRNAPEEVQVHVADMRRLPALGRFDWIVCLDDAVNYLLTEPDLAAAFASAAELLAPGGLLCFDVNTDRTYRQSFGEDWVTTDDDLVLAWKGHGRRPEGEATVARATLEAFARGIDGSWQRSTSEHVQRQWSTWDLQGCLRAVGLEPVACLGQSTGAHIGGTPDEAVHTKVVHVARRPVA